MGRVYTTVDVEVYLDEFQDGELIEELEDRGYTVSESPEENEENAFESTLDSLERDIVANAFQDCKPGTIGNSIYEKMRKR